MSLLLLKQVQLETAMQQARQDHTDYLAAVENLEKLEKHKANGDLSQQYTLVSGRN
jgi:hypothetical protein